MFNKKLFYFLISITINLNSFSINKAQNHWAKIEKKALKSIVKIISYESTFNWLKPYENSEQNEFISGTGFFIDKEGHILTNYHVIQNTSEIKINIPSINNKLLKADVIGIYPERDIALLKLTSSSKNFLIKKINKISHLQLGDSNNIKSGEFILTLGYPKNSPNLISTIGLIGTPNINNYIFNQFPHNFPDLYNYIEISAPINRGNSGGPLLNYKGKVIGINTLSYDMFQNKSFSIPINIIKKNLNYLKKQKVLNIPKFACNLRSVHDDFINYFNYPTQGGCLIQKVYDEGLIKKIGLKKNYLITEINGNKIDKKCNVWTKYFEHPIPLYCYTRDLAFGENVKLVAYKGTKKKQINFILEPAKDNIIHYVYTEINNEKINYEIFGGLVLMNLTLNHVDLLSQNNNNLNQYYDTENQHEPAVIITHVFQNSPASKRYIYPGLVIDTINEIEIKRLDDLKKVFVNIDINSNLRILTKDEYFFILPIKKILKHEDYLSSKYKYNKSELLKNTTI